MNAPRKAFVGRPTDFFIATLKQTLFRFDGLPRDYSNPRNKEPWFCLKPKSQNCSKRQNLTYKGPRIKYNLNYTALCKKYKCHTYLTTIAITVRAPTSKQLSSTLPICSKEYFHSQTSRSTTSTGFIREHAWVSQCRIDEVNPIKNCLKDKIIYLFEDSTIRQFFNLVATILGLEVKGFESKTIWCQPKVAFDHSFQNYNITLYYRSHGPPLQNFGPLKTRPYFSDSIIDIPVGGDGVYIIFNIGAHLFFITLV